MKKLDYNKELDIRFPENKVLLIPDVIDKYLLLKKIDEGQNSVVFESSDPSTGMKLAIKCISIQNFNKHPKEYDILVRMSHKKVIRAIDFFPYPDPNPRFVVIVMPKAETDLLEYFRTNGVLDEQKTCKIIRQILEALVYIHSESIWHRDIKLDNIFIMKDTKKGPLIAIGDFGLAIEAEDEYITGPGAGTILYAPPELLHIVQYVINFQLYNVTEYKNCATYSNNVDSWGTGVIMYILLCGKIPFDQSTPQNIEDFFNCNINFGPNAHDPGDFVNHFKNVSEEAKDLIRSLLTFPNARLSAEEALQHPWFDSFRDENEEEEETPDEDKDMFTGITGNETTG